MKYVFLRGFIIYYSIKILSSFLIIAFNFAWSLTYKAEKKRERDKYSLLPILNLDPKGTWNKNGFHIVFLIFNSLLFLKVFHSYIKVSKS